MEERKNWHTPVIKKIVGYKAKVGARYARIKGDMSDTMSGGDVFPSISDASRRIEEYIDEGVIKHHGMMGGRGGISKPRINVTFIPQKEKLKRT